MFGEGLRGLKVVALFFISIRLVWSGATRFDNETRVILPLRYTAAVQCNRAA